MSLTQQVFSSAAFQVAIKLAHKTIGVISTLILARLLSPEDFAIIAVIALTVHLTDVLSDVGSQQYIIQNQSSNDTDLNTAWTIDIISKLVITALIWIAAPYIAQFADNPLLTDAIRIVSLAIPIKAAKNPVLITLAKEFQYRDIFRLTVTQKLISFSAVMITVLIHPSYWAIIVGDIVSAFALLIGSYLINPYRPQLTLKKLRNQWSFSQWSLLRGFTGYLRSQIDILLVTKFFPASTLGSYHLQREFALIPAVSLFIPATEPLLSAIAKAKHDQKLLKFRITLSLITVLMLITPLSVFIFQHSKLITSSLLGQQWVEYHTLLSYFSLMFFAFCFHALISDCYTALGKVKELFYFDLISTAILIALLISLISSDVFKFALLRGAAGLLITFSLLFLLCKQIQVKLSYVIVNSAPFCLASALGFWITNQTDHYTDFSFINLCIDSALFFGTYALSLLSIRVLLGKHKGKCEELYQSLDHLYKAAMWPIKKLANMPS